MIHEKKVSLGAGYANKVAYEYEGKKYEADLKDGDIVKILDEGQEIHKEFKGIPTTSVVHKVETRNGTKLLSFNKTSINNLIDAFGKDSKNWVGKEVKAWIFKVLKDAKFEYHVYLASSNSEMVEGEDGKIKFLTPEAGNMRIDSSEDEDINFDDLDTEEIPDEDSPFPSKKK